MPGRRCQLAEAEATLRRFQEAIAAGVDPNLYRELDIGVRYEPSELGGSATVIMHVANECVRGGTCALTTRLALS